MLLKLSPYLVLHTLSSGSSEYSSNIARGTLINQSFKVYHGVTVIMQDHLV